MFGELVCGPPGSGKTTYCEGKRQFLSVYDPTRPVALLNLDPANEAVFPYPCDVDVRDLVSHAAVMADAQLGPNGSYLFCAEVIEQNVEWLLSRVEEAVERRMQEVAASGSPSMSCTSQVRPPYLLIDCPGQVEFYVNSGVMHTLVRAMQKRLQCSLCTVHLVDAGIATRDIATYVSSCVLALSTMVDHELPHVNVLTKWDTLAAEELADMDEGQPFLSASSFLSEDFDRLWKRQLRRKRRDQRMAECFLPNSRPSRQLNEINQQVDAEVEQIDLEKDGGRAYKYTKALMEVVDGYGMVGYVPLDVQSQELMLRLTQEIDNAVGNFF